MQRKFALVVTPFYSALLWAGLTLKIKNTAFYKMWQVWAARVVFPGESFGSI